MPKVAVEYSQRELTALREMYAAGQSYDEMARHLGRGHGSVQSRVHRMLEAGEMPRRGRSEPLAAVKGLTRIKQASGIGDWRGSLPKRVGELRLDPTWSWACRLYWEDYFQRDDLGPKPEAA